MPAGVLDEVLLAARTFRDWGFRTRLNLLGGEPTLDLERFALIHSHISHHPLSHDLEMEMTTNGWWLRSWKDTCRFAGIVGEAVVNRQNEDLGKIHNRRGTRIRFKPDAQIFKGGLKFDAEPRAVNDGKTKVAFLTDPWGTTIELTEGLRAL